MRIALVQLKKMTVETMSGDKLGKVYDVIIDLDEQIVVQYQVKHTGMSGSDYLINRDQVARFEEKKIIVYDTVVHKKENKLIHPLKVLGERGVALRNS